MATAPGDLPVLTDEERERRLALVAAEWDADEWDRAIPLEDAMRMLREGTVPDE